MGQDLSGPLPAAGQNNVWFDYNDSAAAIVFLHGIFSDSRNCWLHRDPRDPSRSVYWPALVRSDQRLGGASIFLAGFYTAFDAGPYEIRNCADEVFRALERRDADGRPGPMSKSTIVFVCHSTGGIVARYLLDVNEASFANKTIGLVLIASPSYGSEFADRLGWIARLYNQRLGAQLQWGGWSLRDLDARFRDLLDQRRLPGLRGVEAYENHFIFHRKWLPNKWVVVTEESAGRYFGAPVLLRKTNHFTSVKPDSKQHPAHELLVDFWQKHIAAGVPAIPARDPGAVATLIPNEPPYTSTSLTETAETLAASREHPTHPELFAGDLDRDLTGRFQQRLYASPYARIATMVGIVIVALTVTMGAMVWSVRASDGRHLAGLQRLSSDLRQDTSIDRRVFRFDSLKNVVLPHHLEGDAIELIIGFIRSVTPRSSACQLRTLDDSSRIPRRDVQRALVALRDLQDTLRHPKHRAEGPIDKLVSGLGLRRTNPTQQLSLADTDLRGASLLGLDLRGASLRRACLAGAVLDSTRLYRTDFDSAQLASSKFIGATGTTVQFNWANLRDASFDGSVLDSLEFVGADLSCATFGNTRLENTEFTGAIANWAFFGGATLRGARQWDQIIGFRGAYVADVVEAPSGFVEWAKERGALTNVRQGAWVRAKQKQFLPDSLCTLDP
jgi:uncharacterized protein YjbI with pentapeptide repeats